MQRNAPTLGGFFELHTAGAASGGGILGLWRVDPARDLLRSNARSALAGLLRASRGRRLWLPAYICESVVEGAAAAGVEIDFFPVGQHLEPNVEALAQSLRSGDFVLAVDYFGRAPGAAFLALVRGRRDVGWIEDRAQALDPGARAWGDWLLYSPRKLLGVPDGGIAIYRGGRQCALPASGHPRHLSMLEAQAMRCEPIYATQAYRRFRQAEARQKVEPNPMSTWTLVQLQGCDPAPLVRARRRNHAALHRRLRSLAFYPRSPARAAPFGYAIRHPRADQLWEFLVRRGIYAQRHWRRLPAPRGRFPAEHSLARELITLPCDHRYTREDMRRIAATVLDGARKLAA